MVQINNFLSIDLRIWAEAERQQRNELIECYSIAVLQCTVNPTTDIKKPLFNIV